ncbi:MAG TPA: hypothetical protein VMW29_02825 [Candidatus Bathyarchaeia archaeon]|nr:hypothetical protein [Candidatus Bathyarchaeia archaeon]
MTTSTATSQSSSTTEPTREEKTSFVREEIVGKMVCGYMVGDIKRLLEIKVIENYDGNCNFPIALYVFSCMDFLGYLFAENKYNPSGDTAKRINAYIDLFFTDKAKAEIEPHKTEFVDTFRNGLSHEFFPKISGISRINDSLMSISEKGYWVMDADILARMFLESVENLKKFSTHVTVSCRAYDRYSEIQKENIQSKTHTVSSSTARSSMATTTTLPLELIKRLDADDNVGVPSSKGDTGVAGLEKLNRKNDL